MTRRRSFPVLIAVCAIIDAPALAGQTATARYMGRPLAQVLRELQAGSLRVVFSSALVREDMRVIEEPTAITPREILDQLLRPHGLAIRMGSANVLLVVPGPRSPAPRSAPASTTTSGRLLGRVLDAETGEPIPRCVVRVAGTARQVETDAAGVFEIDELPPGPVSLFVSIVGYALARPTVDVVPARTTELVVRLVAGTRAYTEELTVTAEQDVQGDAIPVQHSLTAADLQNLRGVLTDDPFRAVQTLPGVVADDDFRSEFSVRGSRPGQIGISIDDISTPWLVHAAAGQEHAGSVGMLNADLLERASLAFGSYPQRLGDRTGAWLELALREGSRDHAAARGTISGTNAAVVVEGPLGRARRGSWVHRSGRVISTGSRTTSASRARYSALRMRSRKSSWT